VLDECLVPVAQSKQFEEVNMFHKILVAMDTSTIAVSVFDEALALAKRRIQSHAATRSVLKKAVKSAYIFQPGILFRSEWQNLEIHQEQWKTFEEQELLRTRKDGNCGVTTEFTQKFWQSKSNYL